MVSTSGIVTFLFTDIEGSTRLWQDYPSEMQTALAEHDLILRQAALEFSGHVFKTIGDAFCIVFEDPQNAIGCAYNVQKRLEALNGKSVSIKVRMAIHTGMAEIRDEDYYGQSLNRVARLLALSQGGQILVSLSTQALCRESMPGHLDLLDLGQHRLKDLAVPEKIFQVTSGDLNARFLPISDVGTKEYESSLPKQFESYAESEKESQHVAKVLEVATKRTGKGAERDLLYKSAAELGISPKAVLEAENQILAEQSKIESYNAFCARKKNELVQLALKYLVLSFLLIGIWGATLLVPEVRIDPEARFFWPIFPILAFLFIIGKKATQLLTKGDEFHEELAQWKENKKL